MVTRSGLMTPSTNAGQKLRTYMSLVRFSHTIFALPFVLLSVALAWHQGAQVTWIHGVGILLCMIFARTAAMAFNRLTDHKIDAQNPRTAGRHIPAGLLSIREVTLLTIASSLGFVLSTLLFLPNYWPVALSLPVLAILLGYSYTKRFTSLCHYWLGFALMLSPIAGWLAINGSLSMPPIWLGLTVFFWVGGFDIIYASQDAEFDRNHGVYSVPGQLGVKNALRVAALSHVICLGCLWQFWQTSGMGTIFFIGVLLTAGLLLFEHALVHKRDLARINLAFFHVNAIISFGLLCLGISDMIIQ